MYRADLIVVGAGVLGTFHAYFAARKGLKTILIERNALPSDASTRNFGMLPQSIVEPTSVWADIAQDSSDIYRAIQAEHDITVEETGSLYLASTDTERAVLGEFLERFGGRYACTYLEAGEVQARYPFVRESYCVGGLLFPHDLSLDPTAMLRRLIPYVVETGYVQYVPNTTVVAVEAPESSCVVTDSAGNMFVGKRVIVCSGADYRTLLPEVFARSGLQVCKLQMMRTVPQGALRLSHSILSGLSIRRYPAFHSCPSYDLLDAEQADEMLRDFGIHLLLKSAPDGSVIVGDSHEYRGWEGADGLAERTNPAINAAILAYARTMVDLPSWELQALWNGYYLAHPQEPIYTETVDERIHVITGIGGKGMTTGPGFARQSIETLFE